MKGLIKTVQIEDDVLDVLENMDWREEGNAFLGILTHGQLDRKLYVKVNTVLEAFGGKWNRKLKGHIFPTDPRVNILSVIYNGKLTIEKDGFFETPENVVIRMYTMLERIPELVLEPSAGRGAIVRVVNRLYSELPGVKELDWFLIEKNPERFKYLKDTFKCLGWCGDFLEYYDNPVFDTILMNPPFELQQDILHVEHAYKLLKAEGELVSVMSKGFTFRDNKKSREFRRFVEQNGYWEDLPEGSFTESGTNVNTVLVYLRK